MRYYLPTLSSLWLVLSTINRCADHLEALPIWTSMTGNRRTKRWRRSQHRLQWKELWRKLRIKKEWQPGMPALPPRRQSKSDCSNSFGEPRNQFVPLLANIPPKEADQEQAVSADKWPEHNREVTNRTPWIVGACLMGGALMFLRNMQTRSPASVAAGLAPKQPVDKPPRPDRQLKTGPDPIYMK